MKKSIFLISVALLFIAFNNQIYGQNRDHRTNLNLGLKGGLNVSNIYDTNDGIFEADNKVGFVGGLFMAIPIGKYLGIQPEVLFSQKGYKSGKISGTNYQMKRTINFVDVPILLQLKPFKFITVLAGPQYSYMLKHKDKITIGSLTSQNEENFKVDDLRNNIFGFIWGADLNFNNIILGARAGWDIRNNSKDTPSTIPRYKNTWYQATIGFRF